MKYRKKPTLVELVAQAMSIVKPYKLKRGDIFWKAEIPKADVAVYVVLLALEHKDLYSRFGLKKRLLKQAEEDQGR